MPISAPRIPAFRERVATPADRAVRRALKRNCDPADGFIGDARLSPTTLSRYK
jgi:hypothetical protein